ncbi:MAG: translation elongation factor Ts [Firmicutes bacterium]|nr:translation elongation factor Ts [Bacillota bacterium]
MPFVLEDIKELRRKTGCGIMDCKKALIESSGNLQSAVDYLRKLGIAAVAKKSERVTSEGMVFAVVNSKAGAILEINSETDFVAKNKEFKDFVEICAQTILVKNPKNHEDLLETKTSSGKTVSELLNEKILVIGENIKIKRFFRQRGLVSSYVHAGGKIAVLVIFDSNVSYDDERFKILGKNIAMQVAASDPSYLDKLSISNDDIEHERKILMERVINEGKPKDISSKIVDGRMKNYYQENCLLEQPFIKDSSISVAEYLDNISKSVGTKIVVSGFKRYECGKVSDN